MWISGVGMGCGLMELGWGVGWWSWDEVWIGGAEMGCRLVDLG